LIPPPYAPQRTVEDRDPRRENWEPGAGGGRLDSCGDPQSALPALQHLGTYGLMASMRPRKVLLAEFAVVCSTCSYSSAALLCQASPRNRTRKRQNRKILCAFTPLDARERHRFRPSNNRFDSSTLNESVNATHRSPPTRDIGCGSFNCQSCVRQVQQKGD
jgi:hypothetical protein